jgi:hypothetical protein
MYQQKLSPDTTSALRLTEEDVHDIIGLWVERQAIPQEASVVDVAEGLDISTEEVEELLQFVRARRATVQSGIAQEQARLTDEQRLLAEEQARLWREENCLAEYHIQRADISQKRIEVKEKWTTKKSRIAHYSHQSVRETEQISMVIQPQPLKKLQISRKEPSVLRRVVTEITALLLFVGIAGSLIYYLAALLH